MVKTGVWSRNWGVVMTVTWKGLFSPGLCRSGQHRTNLKTIGF